MLGLLSDAGFPVAGQPEEAECVIVNTCAFIDRAREESVQTILDLARLKEHGRCRTLIVTGCLTQRYGAEVMREMPEIDGILGTANLPAIVDLVRQAANRHDWATAAPPGYLYDASTPRLLTAKVPYAYVKIAEGCDMGCTFCAIPQFRGRHRSRPLGDTRMPWIRPMYLHPAHVNDRLLAKWTQARVVPYIDMPVQHGDDAILKSMRRAVTARRMKEIVAAFREAIPGVTVRTTVLVGFPGETEAAFDTLLQFIEDVRFDRLGVFTYSPEDGTPSPDFADQVPASLAPERATLVQER